jgi:hypothetical protein
LLRSVVAHHIGKLLEPSVYRAHVTTQVIHQDLRRVRPTVHELAHVGLIVILTHAIVFAHQNGHNPDFIRIHLAALKHGPIQYF